MGRVGRSIRKTYAGARTRGLPGTGQGTASRSPTREHIPFRQSSEPKLRPLETSQLAWNCLEGAGNRHLYFLPSLASSGTKRAEPTEESMWSSLQGRREGWRAGLEGQTEDSSVTPSFLSCWWNIPLLLINSCWEMKQSHFYLHLLQAKNVIF